MNKEDKILRRFFEVARWEASLDGALGKGLPHELLREMCKPETRSALYRAIRDGEYHILPPHTAIIPKDTPGEFRTVYVNEAADRVILAIANQLFFDLAPDLIHDSCKSYRKGIGCGAVVREVSRYASKASGEAIGWKSDLSKYFDSVAIWHIDAAFDFLEERHGPSALVAMIREYYHNDKYIDRQGQVCHKYMSLRQGCAVSSWLSDVILRHIDEELSGFNGLYLRYCDDMLFIGPDHAKAMEVLKTRLAEMGLSLNPRKVETLHSDRWFHFLGYSVCGGLISLSPGRIANFQKLVDEASKGSKSADVLTRKLTEQLYVGSEWKCWATQVLPVITSEHDINILNAYLMDTIRAKMTGKSRIGGLGFRRDGAGGCIVRGTGRNVSANRAKTPPRLPRFRSLMCVRKALKQSRPLYISLVNSSLL